MISEIAGWLSSFCFAISALPQVIKVRRTGSTKDLSWGTLGLWIGGEITGIVYIMGFDLFPYPIFANYVFNGVTVGWLILKKWENNDGF